MSTCVRPVGNNYDADGLSSKVALFNAAANRHMEQQAVNPFSGSFKSGTMAKPQFSKEEYGRPVKGSLSEARGFKAAKHICREMVELCEIIHDYGEPLFTQDEKPNDPRKVIRFGDLFTMYTVISDKLVGMLLRARKHKLVDFEGEVLFQRRDDHVPVILLKSMSEIRAMFKEKSTENQPLSETVKEESPEHANSSNSSQSE